MISLWPAARCRRRSSRLFCAQPRPCRRAFGRRLDPLHLHALVEDARASRCDRIDLFRAEEPLRLVQAEWRDGIALSLAARARVRVQEGLRAAYQQHRTRPLWPQSLERLGLSRPERSQRRSKSKLSLHPTVKPVALVADAIRDCSHRNGIILDPFGGAGTTLIAAERTGRKARLIELEPRYVDATIDRWQQLTGKTAVNAPRAPLWARRRDDATNCRLLARPAARSSMERSHDRRRPRRRLQGRLQATAAA